MAGLMGLCRRGFGATRPLMMAMSTPGGLPPNGFRTADGLKEDTGLTGIAVNHNARAELIGAPMPCACALPPLTAAPPRACCPPLPWAGAGAGAEEPPLTAAVSGAVRRPEH